MAALLWLSIIFLLVVGVLAWRARREPLMLRLGLRNAARHRRQTATVVAGLLIGTMVIGASLVTGDSLEAGLRASALGSLGELDIVVSVPGELLVPESLLAEVAAAPLPASVGGTSRIFLDRVSVEHPSEDLYEPGAAVLGFDPVEDRPFGPFTDASTGEAVWGDELGPNDVYVNARLADKIGASAGSVINVTFVEALVPLVPEFVWFNGTLVSSGYAPSPTPGGGPTYLHAPQDVFSTTFATDPAVEALVALVFWPDATNATDLDVELVAPDGTRHLQDEGVPVRDTRNATDAAPDVLPAPPAPVPRPETLLPPEVTNATAGRGNPTLLFLERDAMQVGSWRMEVHAKQAQNQPFTSFVALLRPEYDLERARAFVEDVFGDDPDASSAPERGGFRESLADVAGGLEASSRNLTVARVVAMEGKGTFFYGDAIFMERSAAQRMFDAEGRLNWLKVTAVGDVEAGLESSDALRTFFDERLTTIADSRDASASSPERNLRVTTIKADWLEGTEEAASIFTQFLTLIGSFALVAGVMLIVNIFSMLAEERRHELGIARAVGMTRGRLVSSFVFEGSVYTVLACLAGVVASLLLSFLLVLGINSLTPEDAFFSVPFTPTWSSLAMAFMLGAILTFVTVMVAAARVARLEIAQAIRGEDDRPRRVRGRQAVLWRGGFALFVFLLVGLGVLLGNFTARSLGPALALLALGPLVSLWVRPDRVWPLVALAAGVWTMASYVLLQIPGGTEGDVSAAARGLVLVIAATIVLVHLDRVPRALAGLLARVRSWAAIARVALTYPLARRFRTGLTVSMYGLVLLIITMFSIFFLIFIPDITQQTGDYDVIGYSRIAEPELLEVNGVAGLLGTDRDPFEGVATWQMLTEHFEFGQDRLLLEGEPIEGFGTGQFYGFDQAFVDNHGFALHAFDASFGATERDVWQAVLEDARLVVVSHRLLADFESGGQAIAEPGDVITLNSTSGHVDYVIAGIMAQHYFGGVWMSQTEMAARFGDIEGTYLFRLEPGVDPDAAADRIERAFRPIGMNAESIEEEARRFDQQSTRIFQLLSAYLGLGLIVGVASIGIMTSRAVLERRRELGMLKAIGFGRRAVAGTMLLEVLAILLASTVIGVGLGIMVAFAVFQNQLAGLPGTRFAIPWLDIGQMLLIALGASLLATWVPLKRAMDLPAAEALRTTE